MHKKLLLELNSVLLFAKKEMLDLCVCEFHIHGFNYLHAKDTQRITCVLNIGRVDLFLFSK